MSSEPIFEMTDSAGKVRCVRIVKNHIAGLGSKDFRIAVADVLDVQTGEAFDGVPLSKLVPREPNEAK